MGGLQVAGRRCAEAHGQGQHRSVLARAVVVDRRAIAAVHGEPRFETPAVSRLLESAAQGARVEPGAGEDRRHRRHLLGRAGMGGGGHRELGLAEAEPVGGSALDQGQELDRLGGRAEVGAELHVPRMRDHRALRVGDRDPAAMDRLHAARAHHRGQNGTRLAIHRTSRRADRCRSGRAGGGPSSRHRPPSTR